MTLCRMPHLFANGRNTKNLAWTWSRFIRVFCIWFNYEKYFRTLRPYYPHFNAKHHTSSRLDIDPILPTLLFSSTNLGTFQVPPPSSILVRNHWLTTLIVLGWNEVPCPPFDSDRMATFRYNTSRIRFLGRKV